MLQPVRTKWRKAHKGRIHGYATRASTINYGAYALKALQPERVTGKQIEAARVALTRHMKRQGRVWILETEHKCTSTSKAVQRLQRPIDTTTDI